MQHENCVTFWPLGGTESYIFLDLLKIFGFCEMFWIANDVWVTNGLLTGCEGHTEKYRTVVFVQPELARAVLKDQGPVFLSMARANPVNKPFIIWLERIIIQNQNIWNSWTDIFFSSHASSEWIYFSYNVGPYEAVHMRRSVWAVHMGIYRPGFSKGDWLIPLSHESVI